ncbi:hypothetical protein E2C01_060627 [Portunus trituberculatus]|uniref:Uncharacterized protein n=1 Tax=Portunus trituberculatus TaxID=210409 RepID=A0A5B7H9J5_PORTR|nr:hypothetical protein [Portunus trituberculatus]
MRCSNGGGGDDGEERGTRDKGGKTRDEVGGMMWSEVGREAGGENLARSFVDHFFSYSFSSRSQFSFQFVLSTL